MLHSRVPLKVRDGHRTGSMPSASTFFYQFGICFYVCERFQKFMSFFIFTAFFKKSNSTDLEEKYSSKGRKIDS